MALSRISEVQTPRARTAPVEAALEVEKVPGIVTAVVSGGFYLQDPLGDADATTPEGIFVRTEGAPSAKVGDSVEVSGSVGLPKSEADRRGPVVPRLIDAKKVDILSSGNPLPKPIKLFSSNISADTFDQFLGMRVQLDGAVSVGPSNAYGDIPVASGRNRAGWSNERGTPVASPGDVWVLGNRVLKDNELMLEPVDVGARFSGAVVGVMDSLWGRARVQLTEAPKRTRTRSGLEAESAKASPATRLSVGTYNLKNLSVLDTERIATIGRQIAENLKAPDVLALVEVQDDSGRKDDGTVSSTQTVDALIAAVSAAGGPQYKALWVDPENNADGGEQGGNIRQVLLYREGRLTPAPLRPGDADDITRVKADGTISHNPGRIAPHRGAFITSRKPLVAHFRFREEDVFVVALHLVAALGGGNEGLRTKQAQMVADFLGRLKAKNPEATFIVTGDMNGDEDSQALRTLESKGFTNLIETLEPHDRYSYLYEGEAKAIDHVLVHNATGEADIVHLNTEFAGQASDHDPIVASLRVA